MHFNSVSCKFVPFFHQPHGILIDVGFPLCTSGIAFKYFCLQMTPQCFSNLAAAGIMNADECHFLHTIISSCGAVPPHQSLLNLSIEVHTFIDHNKGLHPLLHRKKCDSVNKENIFFLLASQNNYSIKIARTIMRLARRSFQAVLFRHRSRNFFSACFFAFSTPSSRSLFRMAISRRSVFG